MLRAEDHEARSRRAFAIVSRRSAWREALAGERRRHRRRTRIATRRSCARGRRAARLGARGLHSCAQRKRRARDWSSHAAPAIARGREDRRTQRRTPSIAAARRAPLARERGVVGAVAPRLRGDGRGDLLPRDRPRHRMRALARRRQSLRERHQRRPRSHRGARRVSPRPRGHGAPRGRRSRRWILLRHARAPRSRARVRPPRTRLRGAAGCPRVAGAGCRLRRLRRTARRARTSARLTRGVDFDFRLGQALGWLGQGLALAFDLDVGGEPRTRAG